MKYAEQSIAKYIEDLSARKPTPGGGSASALAGSLGAALVLMALNFTAGKEAYRKFENEIRNAVSELEKARTELTDLVDEDVAAYNKLKEAFKRSKDKKDLKPFLVEATGVPIKILNLCYNAMEACSGLARKVNKNLITDVGCGALLLDAGFEAARFNIEINLKQMDEEPGFVQLRKDIAIKEKDMRVWKKRILEDTKNIM